MSSTNLIKVAISETGNIEDMNQKKNIEDNALKEIIKAIQTIDYGEVVITIHNSKIVQIEKREKKRFVTPTGYCTNRANV